MKDLKSVVTLVIVLAIAGLAILALVSNKGTSQPNQTSQVEENLDSALNTLDSTDLDGGTDTQLDQVDSESSSF